MAHALVGKSCGIDSALYIGMSRKKLTLRQQITKRAIAILKRQQGRFEWCERTEPHDEHAENCTELREDALDELDSEM
jgi:hypothetical protein